MANSYLKSRFVLNLDNSVKTTLHDLLVITRASGDTILHGTQSLTTSWTTLPESSDFTTWTLIIVKNLSTSNDVAIGLDSQTEHVLAGPGELCVVPSSSTGEGTVYAKAKTGTANIEFIGVER